MALIRRAMLIISLLPCFDKVGLFYTNLLCSLSTRVSLQQAFSAVGHSTPHTIPNASLLRAINPFFGVFHVPESYSQSSLEVPNSPSWCFWEAPASQISGEAARSRPPVEAPTTQVAREAPTIQGSGETSS